MVIGRKYLDPGDRLSGRHEPPQVVTVVVRWGRPRSSGPEVCRWLRPPAGAPRNVLIERLDGSRAVIPFPRRLRRLSPTAAVRGGATRA